MVGLGQVAKNMASILLFDTSDEILRALALDSPQIEECHRCFIRQWNKYKFRVKTFQESKALTGVNFGHFKDKVRMASGRALQ